MSSQPKHRADRVDQVADTTYVPRHSTKSVPRHRGTRNESLEEMLQHAEAEAYGVDLTRRGMGRRIKDRS